MPLIQLEKVTKSYQLGDEKFNALDEVSLNVEKGEFLTITGPSGSGKSTLANVISGLDRVSSGRVVVNDRDLSTLSDREISRFRNRTIGFIFQSFNLKADSTALENVTLPLIFLKMSPRERKARATECLAQVGLSDRANHRPSQLSGGQRQRVAIARALAAKPAVLVADEPTGNLDSERGKEILQILQNLNDQGITLLVITHDESVASRANRVVEVRDGRVKDRRQHS
ncbi:MAG TPA: ABC transporter ATP-binding protein [Acidimicrobiales bacterium]